MVNKAVGLKVLIFPLALAFVVMFAVIYIKPSFDKMQSAKKEAATSQKQFADLQKQTAKLSALKAEWETKPEKQLVLSALPEKEEAENYLSEVYERVSRSGVLLSSFQATEDSSSESYVCGAAVLEELNSGGSTADAGLSDPETPSQVPPICANAKSVSLSVQGNWEQIISFLKFVEDTNRVANIQKISVSPKSQSTEEAPSDLLSADLTLELFFKAKSKSASPSVMEGLAKVGEFDSEGLDKLKSVVYAQYQQPMVSESGERNIFK